MSTIILKNKFGVFHMSLQMKAKPSVTTVVKGGEKNSKNTRLFLVTSVTSKNKQEPIMAKYNILRNIYVKKQTVRKEKET